jgi:hypothetical protein
LEQKQRQRSRKDPVLIPAWMSFQVTLEGLVQVFRDFSQDANSSVHIYLSFHGVLGQSNLSFSASGTDLATENPRQMNLEKAPASTAALAFSNQNFLWLVAPLSAEKGWGCQCCEILQPLSNPKNFYEIISI